MHITDETPQRFSVDGGEVQEWPAAAAPHAAQATWDRLQAYETETKREIQVSLPTALGGYTLTLGECSYDAGARVILGRVISEAGPLPPGGDPLPATLLGMRRGETQGVCRAQVDIVTAEGMTHAAVYVAEWGENSERVIACMRTTA